MEKFTVRCLMLGSGFDEPKRKVYPAGTEKVVPTWVKLDLNPAVNPDVIFDLNDMEQGGGVTSLFSLHLR
jgi:hypothetical protein